MNVITLALAQSDHIKRLTLYMTFTFFRRDVQTPHYSGMTYPMNIRLVPEILIHQYSGIFTVGGANLSEEEFFVPFFDFFSIFSYKQVLVTKRRANANSRDVTGTSRCGFSNDLRWERGKQALVSYRDGKVYPDGYMFLLCRKN